MTGGFEPAVDNNLAKARGSDPIEVVADASSGLVSRFAEFTTPDGGLTLDPASERILLMIDHIMD